MTARVEKERTPPTFYFVLDLTFRTPAGGNLLSGLRRNIWQWSVAEYNRVDEFCGFDQEHRHDCWSKQTILGYGLEDQ